MAQLEDEEDFPCTGEAHRRSNVYKRATGRNTFGAWELECGHVSRVANVIHCYGCGATLINCPTCTDLAQGGTHAEALIAR